MSTRRNQSRLTRNISWTIVGMAALVGSINFFDDLLLRSMSVWEAVATPQVWILAVYAFLFFFCPVLA